MTFIPTTKDNQSRVFTGGLLFYIFNVVKSCINNWYTSQRNAIQSAKSIEKTVNQIKYHPILKRQL